MQIDGEEIDSVKETYVKENRLYLVCERDTGGPCIYTVVRLSQFKKGVRVGVIGRELPLQTALDVIRNDGR